LRIQESAAVLAIVTKVCGGGVDSKEK